jgi:hypothetical protein
MKKIYSHDQLLSAVTKKPLNYQSPIGISSPTSQLSPTLTALRAREASYKL